MSLLNLLVFRMFLIFYISLPLFRSKLVLKNEDIKIDNKFYSKLNIELEIIRNNENIFEMEDIYLPSDLVTFLPENAEFTIQIIQGTLDKTLISQFYPLNGNSNFDNLITDYPNGKLYYSKNFGPFYKEEEFKPYIEMFANTFKMTLNTFFDRTAYIVYNNSMILIENDETPCNIHLDAIKETLQHKYWNKFVDYVNYTQFFYSDYKSIKYHISNFKNRIKYNFEILSRKINQDIKFNNQEYKKEIKNYNFSNYLISNRYLEGIMFNFDDFIFRHKINLTNKNILKQIKSKEKDFEVIELIPTSVFAVKYSTLNIDIYDDNKLIKSITIEEINKYFEVSCTDKTEDKFPEIPFTYENKKSIQLNLKYKGNLPNFNSLEINFNLTKNILNFESYSNPEEFGFLYPCGLILIGDEFTITNYMYYNLPNIDNTMPFNIISLTWFVYGFMIVQILNIFLGKSKGKGIFDTLKDRFVAKWSWVWGR